MDRDSTKVLLIASDPDAASVVASHLADASDRSEIFALSVVHHFSAARRLLAQQAFDAVLLDLRLPGCPGLDCFGRLRRLRPSTPVIVLADLEDVRLAVRAVELGASEFFVKGSPDCRLLREAIRHALEKKRLADLFEALLDADDAPRLVVDDAGLVRYANAAARSAFGRASTGLLGKPFRGPLPDGDGESSMPAPNEPEKALGICARAIYWNGAPARLILLRGEALQRRNLPIIATYRTAGRRNRSAAPRPRSILGKIAPAALVRRSPLPRARPHR